MKKIQLILTILIFIGFAPRVLAQTAAVNSREMSFDEIEMLVPNGNDTREVAVRVRITDEAVFLESKKDNKPIKEFKRADIKSAEYSYSKNPRWKTGLGMGAANAVLFPPLLLVAIPLGFTKHRRHWLTIRGADDFAVLKLSKSARKIIVPAFETRTGVKVEAVGEDK